MNDDISQSKGEFLIKRAKRIISDLMEILRKENKYALEMNGEALEGLRELKIRSMKKFHNLMSSPDINKKEIRNDLSRLHQLNIINLKLLRFMVKMAEGYRKVLSKTGICCNTYNKKGYFEQRRVSIRLNCSA